MPGPASSKPFANVGYPFPALVHCPTCDVLQPMHINGVQPALYCGKDMIFYQCTKCGNETTERVTSEEGSSGGIGTLKRKLDACAKEDRSPNNLVAHIGEAVIRHVKDKK